MSTSRAQDGHIRFCSVWEGHVGVFRVREGKEESVQ